LTMPFLPTEFTQVNSALNQLLVKQAISLLDPQPGERIADLFCGLGNFSLAMARRGSHVVGVEGSAALVARARENASRNGLTAATEFQVADLFAATEAPTPLPQISTPRSTAPGRLHAARRRARCSRVSGLDARAVRLIHAFCRSELARDGRER
jgi:tRNA/tmRNA/rRNA uracil-C5-methylase (TrmA/RlmC/RlmD family)